MDIIACFCSYLILYNILMYLIFIGGYKHLIRQGRSQKILWEGPAKKKNISVLYNFFIKKNYFCCFL
jgi:hypothetical protein